MRDAFNPRPLPRQQIANIIESIEARIAGYDRKAIQEAEDVLADARADLAADEELLSAWAEVRLFPYESGDVLALGPEVFTAKDGSVLCWRGQNYIPQS